MGLLLTSTLYSCASLVVDSALKRYEQGGLGAHLWPLRFTEHLGQQELTLWDFLSVSECLKNQEIPQVVYMVSVSFVKWNHSASPVQTFGCSDVLHVLFVAWNRLLWSSWFENNKIKWLSSNYFITTLLLSIFVQKISIIPVTIVILFLLTIAL